MSRGGSAPAWGSGAKSTELVSRVSANRSLRKHPEIASKALLSRGAGTRGAMVPQPPTRGRKRWTTRLPAMDSNPPPPRSAGATYPLPGNQSLIRSDGLRGMTSRRGRSISEREIAATDHVRTSPCVSVRNTVRQKAVIGERRFGPGSANAEGNPPSFGTPRRIPDEVRPPPRRGLPTEWRKAFRGNRWRGAFRGFPDPAWCARSARAT